MNAMITVANPEPGPFESALFGMRERRLSILSATIVILTEKKKKSIPRPYRPFRRQGRFAWFRRRGTGLIP